MKKKKEKTKEMTSKTNLLKRVNKGGRGRKTLKIGKDYSQMVDTEKVESNSLGNGYTLYFLIKFHTSCSEKKRSWIKGKNHNV